MNRLDLARLRGSLFDVIPNKRQRHAYFNMSPPVPSATAHQSGSVLIPCTSSQQSFPAKSAFFAKLEVAISTLPVTVLIGTKEDDIAQFSGDPIHNLDDGEDAWEMIDKALNRVIGYGKTATEIEKMIRRGEYGMDGMLSWLNKCVYELKIDERLLENKVERLINAMLQL